MNYILIILGLVLVWLVIVSVYLYKTVNFFSKLSKDVDKGDLKKIIEKIKKAEDLNKKRIVEIEREVADLDKRGVLHIQKVGLVRFNPFNEMGGDHSFCLSLLDGKDTGTIITGLHTRERTRVYVKEIILGKSKVALSKEETDALKKAKVKLK